MTATAPPRWVVLEDDPTGVQLLAGVALATDDAEATLREAAATGGAALHVLTNSRAVDAEAAAMLVARAARHARAVAPGAAVVLRGDSTLRGHVYEELVALTGDRAPLLVVMPALPSAGRVTRDGVHWVTMPDGALLPVHETEYARDGVFSYTSSDLLAWADERSGGRLAAADGAGLGVERLRAEGPAAVVAVLRALAARGRGAVFAPDSVTLADQELVAAGVRQALDEGIPLVVRASPSAVGCLCGTLAGGTASPPHGRVLVVCGSYVPGSTRQLEALAEAYPDAMVELADDAVAACERRLARDGLAVLATPRIHHVGLEAGAAMMTRLTDAVAALRDHADVVIAKGGITSAEVLRRGLDAMTAVVSGPLAAGGVLLDAGGRAYVIVPGNVGSRTLLRDLVWSVHGLPVTPDTV